MGPQYTAIRHNLNGLHQVHILYFIYLCVWGLIIHIILCEGETKNILILDIGGQNMSYVFASKDTHAPYLSLNLHNINVFNLLKQCTWRMSWF